ncbi:hypothetical protein ACJZ2D_012697 [Fusarium nematophilum]
MEVLGAVASSIALGQAIAAGRHIVNTIRQLPEIQDEFDDLKSDIIIVTAMLDDAQRARYASSTAGEILMQRTAQRLQEINDGLQELVARCGRESSDKTVKAKKRRWLLEGDKLQKLREKAMDAKMNLHYALTSQTSDMMRDKVSELQHQFEMFTIHLSSRAPQQQPRIIEELPENPAAENETIVDGNDPEQSGSAPEQSDQLQPTKDLSPYDQLRPSSSITTLQIRQIPAMKGNKCPRECRCRCHSHQGRSRSASWAIPLLGSCMVSYLAAPDAAKLSCTDKRCERRGGSALNLSYNAPKWLWDGMLSFRASYSSTTGLRTALRPRRVLVPGDQVFTFLNSPSSAFYVSIVKQAIMIYPDDAVIGIGGILENLPDGLEISLRKILSLADDRGDGIGQTRVCEAIQRGQRIDLVKQALKEEPWTVNEWGELGCPPLILAISRREDSTELVEFLIGAGADVKQKDSLGWTPLMRAAYLGKTECMRLLPKDTTFLEQQNPLGLMALHLATQRGRLEAVRFLLDAGAKAAACGVQGETPLHHLAFCVQAEPQTIEAIAELLFEDPTVDIEARDQFGNSPAFRAVYKNNLPLLRWLVQANASLHITNDTSFNIIHVAAQYSNVQVLNYLTGLHLSGIDTHCPDRWNDTPWDNFVFSTYGPDWALQARRRPSLEEQQAFVDLYQGIRDRTAEQDISRLQQVLHAFSEQDQPAACSVLQFQVEEKQKWKTNPLYKWYRAILKQVQEGKLDSAIGGIEGYIEELREEIQSSPWDQSSRYDWLKR